MVNIDLKKKIFDKENFKKVVETEFTTFIKAVPEQEVTIEEFFNFYDILYLSIPIEGQFQSHEYLVKKSSELFNYERDTSEIEPLLNEISKLRERILTANRRIVQLELELVRNNITPSVEADPGNQIVGCTDPSAVNYDPLATLPCNNCCKYSSNVAGPDTGGSEEGDSGVGISQDGNTAISVSQITTLEVL